ncbi:ImmA/IrrE family metallo-endopeptidase [Limosilactobacillus fastidiosus]|uniref:ImmA/IrrE family metallo-endopeptidase n=1 Tax=Limosilactobacillus fastidiosus TaxID=2759855 RepID=A0A7W3TZC1_9LACO|nr:ImmA/IrrE family metallo-endopeptidase [Limosilactobacillus fastidiosus]MBB1086032.1 ImmA/IrrE family metallo-endopeptidase [Limosilactobacillus fastidiosus]MCD7085631.1 ImmA/IrrE family metallo-endopeptidase [Limosilactobacillus fastidiosus]MCD7114161.1 ImmA/IrrE family metallo-endopeptidase [Limosilactobacillus fastidiosus]MCD7116705.1 ImmA/IrrE family metallo-endopeptidase [Limosilactobacillus fastidiosus]
MRTIISYKTMFEAAPESREKLRCLAELVRKELGIALDKKYIDITWVLEKLDILDSKFSYEIVTDDQLEDGVQAQTDIMNNTIYIKESVYEGAIHNNGRDRMTIAHEILHLILHQPIALTLYRRSDDLPVYKNPEWQAECFAGELLMPYDQIKGMTEEEIVEQCKVSERAAHYQKTHI